MSDGNGPEREYASYPDDGRHAGEPTPDPPFARTVVNRLILPVFCLVVAVVCFAFSSSNTQEVVATSNDGVSYVYAWNGQTYAGVLGCNGKYPDANCGSHQFAIWINPSNPGKDPRSGSPQQEWWGAWIFLGLTVVSGAWATRQFLRDARQKNLR